MASGGAWRARRQSDDARARPTQPRFSVALVNAVKNELQSGNAARSAADPPPREDAAPRARAARRADRSRLPDVEGLLASVERQDEHAQMSADALRGDRRARGRRRWWRACPDRCGSIATRCAARRRRSAEHGPLLAVLARMGRAAREPLLVAPRRSVARGALLRDAGAGRAARRADVVAPLGTRLYDPDAGVRRAAVDALAQFPDSPRAARRWSSRCAASCPGPTACASATRPRRSGVMQGRDVGAAAHRAGQAQRLRRWWRRRASALVEVTKQDFGTSRWRWRSWWERHRDQPRVEWMLEGLAHAEAEVRLSASEELRGVSQQEFGYTFDGPKREREESRKKWVDWVRSHPPKQQDRR